MANDTRDSGGNYTDTSGTPYQTPDTKPPSSGTPVKIFENGTTYDGTWSDGRVQKN
jgi:hypothetical protein